MFCDNNNNLVVWIEFEIKIWNYKRRIIEILYRYPIVRISI